MSKSRTKNTLLNIIFGYIAQFGILFISFIGRRIFLKYLTIDYLGISGLYSNILTILSLPELGLDAAVVYSLYKPVAEANKPLVYSLLRYFRKTYAILAFSVFAIGIAIIPSLKHIINSNLPHNDLVIYYILILSNTVASYFVAHKVALLSAYQEQRVHKMVTLLSNMILQILHIIVLIIWGNYYVYIIATVITTIISNTILGSICKKIHKDVLVKQKHVDFDKKPIIRRISSTFLYKIGAVAINSTDNILMSILIGTEVVGLYSNYYVVIAAIQGFIAIITTSLISGVGNLGVTGNVKRQHEIFNMMLLFYHFIAVLGSVGLGLLFNDFITIWLGDEYLFSQATVFTIALNFYFTTAVSPVWMYREANGLFENVKYLMIIRASLNIMLSVLFGKLWGIFGILLATTISLILTNLWYEPGVLFKNVFSTSSRCYWFKQLKYFIISGICFALSWVTVNKQSVGILDFTLNVMIIVVIVFIIFFITSFKSDEVKTAKSLLKNRK
jgi:O-antigen/teichoic acid export membrane protein